jgi:hypothetical protein
MENFKRYLVFAIAEYYPCGGMGDCVWRCETIEEAKKWLIKIDDNGCSNHIYDVVDDKYYDLDDFQQVVEALEF